MATAMDDAGQPREPVARSTFHGFAASCRGRHDGNSHEFQVVPAADGTVHCRDDHENKVTGLDAGDEQEQLAPEPQQAVGSPSRDPDEMARTACHDGVTLPQSRQVLERGRQSPPPAAPDPLSTLKAAVFPIP